MSEQVKRELDRRFRVLDSMLSAHAILRDRYSRRAATVDLVLLGASILLCVTTFLDPLVLEALRVDNERARIALGALSALAFFASLIQWRVDWKERAGEHGRACASLAKLKGQCRDLSRRMEERDAACMTKAVEWFEMVDGALAALRPIPDEQFTVLKARHRRKVELSRLLDRYPAAPLMLLRAKLWVRHVKGLIAEKATSTEQR